MAKQSHPYKSKENIHSSKLEEPSAAYVSADLRGTYLDIVSEDMFRSAISKAVSDFDKGLVISHNQIDELVKARMGWKYFGHLLLPKDFSLY